MKIVTVHERTVPMGGPIRNAYIDFSKMTTSIVAITTDVIRDGRRVTGYGFISNGRYGSSGILRERLIPRLLEADPRSLVDESGANLDPARVLATVMKDEKPGGHGERPAAVGAIDMAVWDLVGKIEGVPLYRALSQRFRTSSRTRVFVYAAGGYYREQDDVRALVSEMKEYQALGYTAFKMKIGGAPLDVDRRRIEAVLDALGDRARLAVDANGRLAQEDCVLYAQALSEYPLWWFEEPCDPLDFALLSEVAATYDGALATGENLFSTEDARNLVRYGGLRREKDVLQMDPALSYGLVEYWRTLGMLQASGWQPASCIPHGGHQMALHAAGGLGLGGNESYPKVFDPFGNLPDGTELVEGHVRLPDAPGIGFELNSRLMRILQIA